MSSLLPAPFGLLVALVIDRALGELPNRLHPVAWFGSLVAAVQRRLPLEPRARGLAGGVLLVALGLACVALLSWLHVLLRASSALAADLLALFFLQACFAQRALLEAGHVVERALLAGDLGAARAGLAALCSRDPATLEAGELAGAATSSLAENLSDSVVAPLFYYALFGLPGALAFRVVNTLDAMVGYRGRYEWLGKPAARLDDVLGLVPARLTVVFLGLAALPLGLPLGRGLRVMARDGRSTPSPNGGLPMAMVAGLLGVQLVKPGTYALGAEGATPTPDTLTRARRLVGLAGTITALLTLAAVALRLLLAQRPGALTPLGWPG